MTEYALLVGAVCLGAATALAGLGPGLLKSYQRSLTILIAPVP
jgi:Flp pilus assembly pilin Flp